MGKQFRKFKIGEGQFRMMELLYRKGPMLQRDISEELGVDYKEIKRLVEALRKKNMVLRRTRTLDKRFISVAASSFGKWVMEFVEPGAAWTMREAVKGLSEAEQEQLISLAKRVEDGAKNAGEYAEAEHRERERKLGIR